MQLAAASPAAESVNLFPNQLLCSPQAAIIQMHSALKIMQFYLAVKSHVKKNHNHPAD